mmetsp:Transcript_73260/g.188977  ORF Transcript_73260/g.188977 Transcript_73260/m.188977 type:complete len:230 (-) Transcript_73260:288-977(-)
MQPMYTALLRRSQWGCSDAANAAPARATQMRRWTPTPLAPATSTMRSPLSARRTITSPVISWRSVPRRRWRPERSTRASGRATSATATAFSAGRTAPRTRAPSSTAGPTATAPSSPPTATSTRASGTRTAPTGTASTSTRTAAPTTVSGRRMRSAEKASSAGQTVPSTRASSFTAASMAWARTSRAQDRWCSRVSSTTTRWMARAPTTSGMAENTTGSGTAGTCTAKAP